jgi:pimeloyl-ACP methyl ester carboxylesterase
MATTSESVKSADGTTIDYETTGTGPAIIMVYGASGTRSYPSWIELANALAPDFTVYSYERRGRGASGDTAPYAVQREVEDIEALIDAAGGTAFLYGVSSGAVLALEAASALPDKVEKVVLYEPPFIVDDSHAPLPDDYVERLDAAIAAGDPSKALEIFFTDAFGMPAEYVEPMKTEPWWDETTKVAHTIAYDGRIMGSTMSGKPLPEGAWSGATMPVLVLVGGNSEPFFHSGGQAAADVLPNARFDVLAGQDHDAKADALAPALKGFFTD